MRNTIIVTVLLFIGVIAASIYYFSNINKEQHNILKPLKYLPENTFLIASIKNDEVTDNIFKDFDLFDALLGQKEIQLLKKYKNQILRHEALNDFIENQDLYISFHPESDSLNTLYTIPTSNEISESDLNYLIQEFSKTYKITSLDTLGEKITALKFGSPDTTLYTVYYKNLIFASQSKNTILSILDKSKPKLSEKQIDYFINSNSRNTPLSVYFPHQQFSAILKHFQESERGVFADQFANLEGQSAWNINFKQDALMLTGESEVENPSKNYLALFRYQSKKTQRLYNYFPSNTTVFMEYSLSSYPKFEADLHKYFEVKDETKKVKSLLESFAKNRSSLNKLTTVLQHNFALVELTNRANIAFVGVNDTIAWKDIASDILENVDNKIYRFKESNIPYALYGDAFKTLTRPYLTRVDDVLILANSSSDIQNYLNSFEKKDLLTGTLGFKNFEKLQGNEANVTLFVHNKNALSKILYSLTNHYQKKFRDKENYGYQDFYSWSIQLSGNNGNLSSQIYALYKSKNALGGTAEWTYQLNDKAITAPFVFDHSDSSQMILIQELNHTLHAIHPSGSKLWSTVISGRIVGDMKQLPDKSIVFVTDKNRLYRIDTSGKVFKGYSTSIPDEPIAAPTIAKVQNIEGFLIPTTNTIHAYDLDGNRIEDWKKSDFEGRLLGEIQVIGSEFVIGSSFGRVYFFNNDGTIKKEVDISGDVEFKAPLGVINLGNNNFEILAYDNQSKLYRMNQDKILSETKIESNTSKYFAAFANVNSSSSPEFILLSENKLQVFETNSDQAIFQHNFTKNIDDKPQFFKKIKSNEHLIGISSKATNLVYLFDENGALMEGFPVEGQPLFYYGKINYNSETYLLAMRRDKKLHAFKHQK